MGMFVLIMSSWTIKNHEVTLGKYVLEDASAIDMAWLVLSEEHQFVFTRNMFTSYWPSGSFAIENGVLILIANEDDVYTFKIEGDALIFKSDVHAEGLLKIGSRFTLIKDESSKKIGTRGVPIMRLVDL